MQRRPVDVADMVEAELQSEKERATDATTLPPPALFEKNPAIVVDEPVLVPVKAARDLGAVKEEVAARNDPRRESEEEEEEDEPAPQTPNVDLGAPTQPPPPGYAPEKAPRDD